MAADAGLRDAMVRLGPDVVHAGEATSELDALAAQLVGRAQAAGSCAPTSRSTTSRRSWPGCACRWRTPPSTGDGTSSCCSTGCGHAADAASRAVRRAPGSTGAFGRDPLAGCAGRHRRPAARGRPSRPRGRPTPTRSLHRTDALSSACVLRRPRRPLVAPASARADVGQFIPGETIDGPVTSLGDLDVARDGTGAVVYVKPVGGADHVFVSRLQDGAWQPPEQLDAGLAASSQPVVAAGDGGKLAIAFISGGSLFTTVKPAANQPYSPLQLVASPALNPSIDLSINDVAYVSFTNPAGGGGGDVDIARKDRKATAFAIVPSALDIAATNGGRGRHRPLEGRGRGRRRRARRVGRGGQVFARRVFEQTVSAAPQPARSRRAARTRGSRPTSRTSTSRTTRASRG